MGKVTLESNPETYKLSNTQRDRYNKIYPHLAYELSNIYGSKTSFSLGYMFKHLYPSSPIPQMLRSKTLPRDPKKRVAILYIFNTPRMDVVQENGY